MRRTLLALAIAGLSVAAYASPPPGGGPPTPIDVNVTNPELSVSVVPSVLSPADFFTRGVGFNVTNGTGSTQFGEGLILTDLMVQLVVGGTTGQCSIVAKIEDGTGVDLVNPLLGMLVVKPGWDLAPLIIPIPDLAIPAQSKIKFVGDCTGDTTCYVNLTVYGRKP